MVTEPTTVGQHAVRFVLGILGISVLVLVLAFWAGLIGGLSWAVFQEVWGWFA